VEKLKNQLLRSIVLLGLLLVLPVWGGAEAATASGSCGSNLRWTLDDAGLLTITGSGSMGSYSRSSVPWASYRGQIKAVEVGDGVTTISADAFYECDQIKTIRLPETLTAIGNHAFGFCQKLDGITIPAGVKTIPEGFCEAARTQNGTIEAIYAMDKAFFLGTQFHPELMPEDPRSQSIFRRFIKAAESKKRSAKK